MENRFIPLLVLAVAAFMACSEQKSAPSAPESTLLFAPGDGGSKFYRIPALLTAADGTLIAVADKRIEAMGDLPNRIDIVARRSTDSGRTWSPAYDIVRHRGDYGYGDAALVTDRTTGDVLCIFASGCGLWASTPEVPCNIDIARSTDNGLTWSAPERITPQIYGAASKDPAARQFRGAFAASGRALQLGDGTLMFVIAARTRGDSNVLSNYVCASSDGGHTWQLLPTPADTAGDEAKLAELADGRLLMSIRNPAKGHRKYAISADRGQTWSRPALWHDMPEPACNGDIVRYTLRSDGFERNRLLHSIPLDSAERRNVAVLMSYDEGQTWPVRRTVWAEDAGYSSLTVLSDGTIGLLTEVGNWERGFEIWFSRITPEWLTEGQDSYK